MEIEEPLEDCTRQSTKKRRIDEVEFERIKMEQYNPMTMPLNQSGEPLSMIPSVCDIDHRKLFKEDQFYLFSALPLTDEQKGALVKHLRQNT